MSTTEIIKLMSEVSEEPHGATAWLELAAKHKPLAKAVGALFGGKPTREKFGHWLKANTGEYSGAVRLSGKYDTHARAWRYRCRIPPPKPVPIPLPPMPAPHLPLTKEQIAAAMKLPEAPRQRVRFETIPVGIGGAQGTALKVVREPTYADPHSPPRERGPVPRSDDAPKAIVSPAGTYPNPWHGNGVLSNVSYGANGTRVAKPSGDDWIFSRR